MKVAILCAAKNSIYKEIRGLDVYDEDRGANMFPGGMPVIAHPPCRCWSAYCSHQARPVDREAEMLLGKWCVGQVRLYGGILEQPAHSRLFAAAGLPCPKDSRHLVKDFSLEVSQFWFGDRREKSTWLFFSQIPRSELPQIPFRLKPEGGDRRIWQLMSSKNQRSATPRAMALWLVQCARKVQPRCPICEKPQGTCIHDY